MVEALAPDHVLTLDLGAQSTISQLPDGQLPNFRELSGISFGAGDAEDFHELSRFHYIEHLASEEPLNELDWHHIVTGVRVARYRDRTVGVAVFLAAIL